MYIIQSVLNNLKNLNPKIKTYILGLLLSSNRKNCVAMSASTKIRSKQYYDFLSNSKEYSKNIEEFLLQLSQKTHVDGVKRTLVIDPSTIVKTYAKKIDNLCYDRSGCTKNIERCLVPIYAAVADKNITIPLTVEFWVQEKITGKKRYKSKIKITQKLILQLVAKGLFFDFISLDGAYATTEMFAFFEDHKHLSFSMRIPGNRVIETADGIREQLKNHPALMLKRNEREKTIQANLKGVSYYFTIQKRKSVRGGWERVFIISNMQLQAKEQVAAYDQRWPLEKSNRTGKQKFGAAQCQATSESKQKAHIMAGFLAYAICDTIKNDYKSKNVDDLVNKIRIQYFDDPIESRQQFIQRLHSETQDPIENLVQNQFKKYASNIDSMSTIMH